jgi:hypothetical protein
LDKSSQALSKSLNEYSINLPLMMQASGRAGNHQKAVYQAIG